MLLRLDQYPTLYSYSIHVEFLRMGYFSIFACLPWCVYLQFTTYLIIRIIFRPKTSCPRLLSLILWYVRCTVKVAATRIPIHSSASSMYFSCILYVRTIFLNNLWILSFFWFWNYGGSWLHFYTILLFYQIILKLITNEFYYLIVRDVNCPGILG